MDACEEMIEKIIPFLEEIKNRTPGSDFEVWLNENYGPRTSFYEDIAHRIKIGVNDGWAANIELSGRDLRRSRVAVPSEEINYFGITAVYMNAKNHLRGQYHLHPYGEVNMIFPIDPTAELKGPNGWSGAGWTAPAPASHHYPEARNGALIALVFLPAGRISQEIEPPRDPVAALRDPGLL